MVVDNPSDCHNIQVDIGFFEDGTLAMGCVIRNNDLQVIMIACIRVINSADASITEAMAIAWGLQLALELNLTKIIIQSDALTMVDHHIDVSTILELITVDYNLLMEHFEIVSIVFHRRESNSDGHHMVGIGKLVGCRTWLGCIPFLDAPFVPSSAFSS